jgi:hypothetical protein
MTVGYNENPNMMVYPPSPVWVEKGIQFRISTPMPRKMDMDCLEQHRRHDLVETLASEIKGGKT